MHLYKCELWLLFMNDIWVEEWMNEWSNKCHMMMNAAISVVIPVHTIVNMVNLTWN